MREDENRSKITGAGGEKAEVEVYVDEVGRKHVLRARKRSSLSIATELTRRIATAVETISHVSTSLILHRFCYGREEQVEESYRKKDCLVRRRKPFRYAFSAELEIDAKPRRRDLQTMGIGAWGCEGVAC